MISINKNIQSEILMTTMEEIVPEDSLFRKIDKYIDFTFIYDKVKELYCENNGRPSIDPVVLFKIVFIQTLDGIKSMRQTCKKIKVDAEYRWFLGIPFGQDTPHFSTFSKNYERRFKDSDIFEDIFVEIVNQAIKYNLIDGTTFYTDSTHKKAKKEIKKLQQKQNVPDKTKEIEAELKKNASQIVNDTKSKLTLHKLYTFINDTKSGSKYDLKQHEKWQDQTVSYRGIVLEPQDIGNLNFGYIGRTMVYNVDFLTTGAGAYQLLTNYTNPETYLNCFSDTFCDDPRDTYYIRLGAIIYDSQN